jgi:hypothetical protein
MQDEKFKDRMGKSTYVHSVKLLRNAGDLAVHLNRTSPGSTVSRTRKAKGNKSEEDSENDAATRQRQAEKPLPSSSFRMHFEIWL